MAGNLRTESHLLDQKFDAQPGAHFLIKRMFKQNGGMHYEFSCEAACDASVKYFSCRRATSDATASGVPVFSITSSATARRCWRVAWAAEYVQHVRG